MKVALLLLRHTWRAFAIFIFFYPFMVKGQVTITGTQFEDAPIRTSLNPSEPFATTNYGWWPRNCATAWTHSGYDVVYRSLMKFDLSSIPAGSTITSATLNIYSDPAYTSGENSNHSLTSSNAIYFERVTQGWDVNTVTWNTQPSTTTDNRIYLSSSSNATENLQIDISGFVQDMVNNPSSNYGIMMGLENEIYYTARNYASSDHANTAIRPSVVINYTPGVALSPLKQRLDYVFGALNQEEITTGILTDYGIDLANPSLFNGALASNNYMDIDTWRALYGSLLSSTINPSSSMIHLKTINQRMEDYWQSYDQNNPIVDIPMLFVEFQSLRGDAVSSNLISISNDQLFDVSGRAESPYTYGFSFAAAPSISYDDDGDVTFMLRPSLFVNSSPKSVASLQVDFGDGVGYQLISDSVKQIVYNTGGEKDLQYKITFTDASEYYGHSKFTVYKSADNMQARYDGEDRAVFRFPRSADNVCPDALSPDPEFYNGVLGGAFVTVEYGAIPGRPAIGCSPQFIRPLVLVEGFDTGRYPAFGVSNWDYDDIIERGTNGGLFVSISGGILSDQLDVAGYDLIFVDLGNATDDIIRNAYLLENILQWVNANKINNPNTGLREPTVVLGQSMGGLIARYGVSDMEKRWIANPSTYAHHEVRLVVTQDTPHRGANIPIGFQALINDLEDKRLTTLGLATYGIIGGIIGSALDMSDVVPALKQGKQLLDAPASQQMLIAQDGRTNTFLDGQYRTMISFGPTTPSFEIRAISNGSECGQGQQLQAGGEILYANADLYVNRLAFFTAQEIIAETATTTPGTPPGLGALVRVPFHLLIPFTGKNWKTTFEVRATPSSEINNAYSGSISFDKKVLLFVNINIGIFSGSRASQPGALPIDSSPGGYYDMTTFKASVPDDPSINAYPIIRANLTVRLISAFNFVPTFSALDINSPISESVLTSMYTNGSNTTYPSNFPNFITQDRNQFPPQFFATYNTRHINFNFRTGTWFFNLLQGSEAVATGCAFGCPTNPDPPFITGVDKLCQNSEVYTVNNVPSGYTSFWTSTGPFTTTGGGTGNTITVVPTGSSGNGFVTARIIGNGCTAVEYSKELELGSPAWPPIRTMGDGTPVYFEPGPDYSYYPNQSTNFQVNDYPYRVSGAPVYWGAFGAGISTIDFSSGNDAWITFTSGGTYSITVSTTGPCGPVSAINNFQVVNFGFRSIVGSEYSYYPNPVVDNLTVGSRSTPEANATKNSSITQSTKVETFSVNLYDGSGNLLKSAISTRDEIISIDTKELSSGTYYLHLFDGTKTYKEPIIVKH